MKKEIDSGASEIKLRDLTNFEWDEACFYLDYNYKTNEINNDSNTWRIGFALNQNEVTKFRIRTVIAELRPSSLITDSYCYNNSTSLQIKTSQEKIFILLK